MIHMILKQLKKNEEWILSENLKKQSADVMMVESQMQYMITIIFLVEL